MACVLGSRSALRLPRRRPGSEASEEAPHGAPPPRPAFSRRPWSSPSPQPRPPAPQDQPFEVTGTFRGERLGLQPLLPPRAAQPPGEGAPERPADAARRARPGALPGVPRQGPGRAPRRRPGPASVHFRAGSPAKAGDGAALRVSPRGSPPSPRGPPLTRAARLLPLLASGPAAPATALPRGRHPALLPGLLAPL